MHLKESYFPGFWKVSSVVLVFKNVGEKFVAKNYCRLSFLFVVSKIFPKLVNNRVLVTSRNVTSFFRFPQYGSMPP